MEIDITAQQVTTDLTEAAFSGSRDRVDRIRRGIATEYKRATYCDDFDLGDRLMIERRAQRFNHTCPFGRDTIKPKASAAAIEAQKTARFERGRS